jgi:uncharacterized protein YlxW (UPF0749 family)
MDIAIYIKDTDWWQLDKTVNSDDKNLHKEDKFFINQLLIDGAEYIKVGHTMYSIV